MASFFEQKLDEQVLLISTQLAEAVELILSPNTSRDKRMAATRVCEEFKNNSTYLTTCGIYLYKSHPNFVVKHFGLQLLQHAVKFNWNTMPPEEKENLKLLSLELIQGYTGPLLEEPSYLKDGIAKFTVEIMKREWPQQWPEATQKLSEIAENGPSQLFTVLRTLLCLAEESTKIGGDLPAPRRRDMMSSLTAILKDLFKFFINTLQMNVDKMKELKILHGNVLSQEVLIQKALAESVLTTLCGYLEWVNVKFLLQENAILLQTLCLLLQDDDLRLKAADCLETIASRKGPVIERKPLLILFSMDAINLILSSVTNISDNNEEEKHEFMKRICNILSILGQQQLAVLWGAPGCDIDEPTHFHIYLEALIFLLKQKNMLTSDVINRTWACFLRNSVISKNPTFCSYIPQILEIAKTKISRAQHPLVTKDPALYLDVDFGTPGEKFTAWTSLRASTKDIVQDITVLYPTDAFQHAASWLLKLTSTPVTTSPVTETSDEYLEWDSLTSFTGSVMSRLFSNERTYVKELLGCQVRMENATITICELAKKCIESLVQYETEELLLMNQIMLCLEPFIPFLQFHYDLLKTVIQKILAACVYDLPNKQNSDDDDFKGYEYRRISASTWVRLCITHGRLLINIIDDLTKHIQNANSQVHRTSFEKSMLAEGLVVISNGYVNFEKQSKYLNELLAPTRKIWMSAEIEQALSSPESFMSFIGLDNPNKDVEAENHRYTLNMCLRIIHVVLKRAEPPKDCEEQIQGGFKTRLEDEPLNAAATAVLPLLSSMFHLNRVVSSLWLPSVRTKIPACYQEALGMHEAEKAAIFGVDGRELHDKPKEEKKKKTNVEQMKTFLYKLTDSCALMLSDCSRLGEAYYENPLIGQYLVDYVILPWKPLPNYRLRNYFRNFLKMFCRVCPPAYYESAVVPVMVAVLTIMIEHLNKEWDVVRSREMIQPHLPSVDDTEIKYDEDTDNHEIIENQLVHLLTKNFVETFFALCTMRRPTFNAKQTTTEEPVNKMENPDDLLEDLPKFLLKHPVTCQIVLSLPFVALQWPDTAAFTKAVKLCVPFIKQSIRKWTNELRSSMIVQNPPRGVAMSPEMFEEIFTLCLKGLQLMGHHLELQSQLIRNAVIIYDTLRPLFPSLRNILLQVPNIDPAELNKYDLTLFSNEVHAEKQKKKIFRGLLSGLIGKEIGKMFEHDITILNLPAMPIVKKETSSGLLDTNNKDLGLIRLFEPAT